MDWKGWSEVGAPLFFGEAAFLEDALLKDGIRARVRGDSGSEGLYYLLVEDENLKTAVETRQNLLDQHEDDSETDDEIKAPTSGKKRALKALSVSILIMAGILRIGRQTGVASGKFTFLAIYFSIVTFSYSFLGRSAEHTGRLPRLYVYRRFLNTRIFSASAAMT